MTVKRHNFYCQSGLAWVVVELAGSVLDGRGRCVCQLFRNGVKVLRLELSANANSVYLSSVPSLVPRPTA